MLVLMTLSDLERRDLRGKIFRANLLYTVWSRTTKFCRATHMGTGERHISRSQLCPLCKRAVPQFSQFEGFFLFMLFNAELPNLTWSHIWGACFRGTASPHPNGVGPALPNFGGSVIFMRTPFVTGLPDLIIWRGYTYTEGLVFRGSHAPPKWGQDQCSPIWGFPFIYAYTVCCRTTKFDMVTHMGRGLVFRVEQRCQPRRRDPSSLQFWGFHYIYAYTLWRRITKFDVVTDYREDACFYGPATAPTQRSRAPVLPNFWVSPLSLTTLFKDERPNWNW